MPLVWFQFYQFLLFYYLHSIFFDIYTVGFVFVIFPNFLSYLKLFLVILPSKSKSLRL